MRTSQLTLGLKISRIGLGAWALGGDLWGRQDDRDSIAAIHRALDLGVNWIDTAPVYGQGHSEEIIARALRNRAERPYLFTKCGLALTGGRLEGRLKAESIRREVEASLRRLEADVIDVYQIHWPYPETDLEEGWGTVAELQREGKVRFIGVSNFNVEQLRRVQTVARVDCLQPPYSLLERGAEDSVLPFCQRERIGVIVYSVLHAGLLTGAMTEERAANLEDWRAHDLEFSPPRLLRNLSLVERLREIGGRRKCSPGDVAIAWVLHNEVVDGAIVGFRRSEQVDGLIGAAELELSDAELAEIHELLV